SRSKNSIARAALGDRLTTSSHSAAADGSPTGCEWFSPTSTASADAADATTSPHSARPPSVPLKILSPRGSDTAAVSGAGAGLEGHAGGARATRGETGRRSGAAV